MSLLPLFAIGAFSYGSMKSLRYNFYENPVKKFVYSILIGGIHASMFSKDENISVISICFCLMYNMN